MVAVWPVGFGHSAAGGPRVGESEGMGKSVPVGDGVRASVGEGVGFGAGVKVTVVVAI